MGAEDPEGEAKRAFLAQIDAKMAAAGHPIVAAAVVPVAPAAAVVPVVPVAAAGPAVAQAAMPPVVSAPAHLRGTEDAPDLSAAMRAAMGRLPFVPPAPAAGAAGATGKRSGKTVKSKVMPSRAGGQTMALDAALQRPTPNLPFAGTRGDAGAVYVPALDARQYAALRAELALQVAARQETLRRYQVPNEAALRALEEEWMQPGRWAEYVAAVGEFAGILLGKVQR